MYYILDLETGAELEIDDLSKAEAVFKRQNEVMNSFAKSLEDAIEENNNDNK